MVPALHEVETGLGTERPDCRLEEVEAGEPVARPLDEEHGHLRLGQVIRPFPRGPARGVEGESEEDETPDRGKDTRRRGLRRHPPAHRLPAGEERKPGSRRCRGPDGRLHRLEEDRPPVGEPPAGFHVREVVAEVDVWCSASRRAISSMKG